MQSLDLVMAQLNTLVGDFEGNAGKIIERIRQAEAAWAAPVVVFPELAFCGYPPEDLLLRPSLAPRAEAALARVAAAVGDAWVVLGYPKLGPGHEPRFEPQFESRGKPDGGTAADGKAPGGGRAFGGGTTPTACNSGLRNMAGVFHRGELVGEYAKRCLPNYRVFDEKRYFEAGDEVGIVEIQGLPVGLSVCEDIWEPGPAAAAAAAGARLIININASPYHRGKHRERREAVACRARENGIPVVYVNQVGGQDELVFDGGSFAVNADGGLAALAPCFEEGAYHCRVELSSGKKKSNIRMEKSAELPPDPPDDLACVYRALVLGTRDYVAKNGFPGAVLGLSGGIDSALTLAVAVDALGAGRVEALMMPFRYTAPMSIEDAAEETRRLGARYQVISIEPLVDAFMASLAEEFAGLPADVTEQNIQARCRGVLLMAISNKKGSLVLTTGNKSELAVGYSTLYGDMAGGFDVLKDVPKTLVYELAKWRNREEEVIPARVIERAPSAELAPDQKDEDNLPPYPVLDRILALYIEEDESVEAIVERGIPRAQVERAVSLVDKNEYKRRQAPVGVRITRRGFGRDRRYPITSGWTMGD